MTKNYIPARTLVTTLDELITVLEKARSEMGGNVQVAIDDKDTSWHLFINTVRPSNRWPTERLLIGCDDWTLERADILTPLQQASVDKIDGNFDGFFDMIEAGYAHTSSEILNQTEVDEDE